MTCFWNNNQSQIFMVVVSTILLKYFCDDSYVGLRVWLGVCSFDYLLQRGRYKREMNVGILPAEIKMLFLSPCRYRYSYNEIFNLLHIQSNLY